MENHTQSLQFKSIRNMAMLTTIMLVALIILDTLNIFANLGELVLASSYPDTVSASLIEGQSDFTGMPGGVFQTAIGLLSLGVGVFMTLAYIATIIIFLIWFHRSYSNLKPLGSVSTDYSPAWAVGCWFVPLVNLVRPYAITKELWDRSDPEDVQTELSPSGLTIEMSMIATPMFGLWWALWIISNIFNNLSSRFTFGANSLEDHISSFWLSIIASALTIAAAYLAIRVVRAISVRQEVRHQRLMAKLQPPTDHQDRYSAPPIYPPPSFT